MFPLLWIENYRSLEIPPNLLYHGFSEEPWSPPGMQLAGIEKERKKQYFPFSCRRHLPSLFGLVYILLITLTIAYISHLFYSSPFHPNQRASEQATPSAFFLIFLHLFIFRKPARSELYTFPPFFVLSQRECIGKLFFFLISTTFALALGNPGVFDSLVLALSTRWLVCFFYLRFQFCTSFKSFAVSLAPRLN